MERNWAEPSLVSIALHCTIALAIQTGTAFITGSWWIGAAYAAGLYIGREHSQAEYRWMANLGVNRSGLKWWSGFDYSIAWTSKGLLDWICPAALVSAVALIAS